MYLAANVLMCAVFVLAAALQYNDPDPLRWIGIYALAALGCTLAALGRSPGAANAIVALVSFGWGASLAPDVIGSVSVAEVFGDFAMKDERVEVAREMGGLLIVALWMAVLTVVESRRRRRGER